MRNIGARLGIIALILFILTASSPAGTFTSPQYVPMPPGDFVLVKADHFDIYYDSNRVTDVNDVVVAADAAYNNVTAFYGNYDYRDRIILASSHDQYSNILYNYLTNDNIPDNNVASAWGDAESGTIVIETPDQLPNFDTLLAHQFAKIVLRTKLISNKYNMPVWFAEGLAIYVSGDLSDSGKSLVEDACRNGKMMSIDQVNSILDKTGDPSVSQDEVSMAYAQSGMLVQYIVDKYSVDTVRNIIQDYATFGDLDKAFQRRLGYGPEGMNADWQNTLKGDLRVQDGVVTSEHIQGYVTDGDGAPIGNETVMFTCMRNDSVVYHEQFVNTTNSSGFYQLNVTYGPFDVHIDRPGYQSVDDTITLQKGESRLYNLTMAIVVQVPSATPNTTQNVVTSPQGSDNSFIYIALGIVNALAILLVAFIFIRARK